MAERRMPSEDDYPNNSSGSSKIERRVEPKPVQLRGDVKQKRSIFGEVRKEFINEDMPSVGSYILYDIVFPAVMDLFSDIGHGFVDAAFGGGDRRRYSRGRSRYDYGRDSYISYNRMYDDRSRSRRERDDERYEMRRRNRDFEDIIFDYREDAEDVQDRMCDYLERYGDVPVSYLYDLCGMTVPGDFTKDDWGWTDLTGLRIRKVRGGWMLDLPRVRPI